MNIIIGCSGSTGSSLLKTMLNRHSQIFAGPETGLFAYPQVYSEWDFCKTNLLSGIQTDGWAVDKGMNLLQEAYGWQTEALKEAIQQAISFKEFVRVFFQGPLKHHQKKYWIEKTPINAYGFQAFLDHYPNGKVIQIVRNPYDTVASLVARGLNAYWAAGYYVYNTAIATSSAQDARYYQLSYEDLAAQPKPTLAALFDFLAIPFEETIIQARHEQRAEPTTMKGWKHEETAAVKSSSIGRFQELPREQQELIKTALATFSIHPKYLKKYQIQFANCAELCEQLNYPFLAPKNPNASLSLKKYYWRSRLGRIRHKGIVACLEYPGLI